MSLLDILTAVFAPHECLACHQEGRLLCADCSSRMPAAADRCYKCQKMSASGATCADCRPSANLDSVRAGVKYTGSAKDLVWQLKFRGAQAAARLMAEHMVSTLNRLPIGPGTVLIYVPTASARFRERGYDQAQLLARAVGRQTRLPLLNALARQGQHHQVGSGREQRLQQLNGDFRVTRSEPIRGQHIIVIDDVVTTGATLDAAAQALRKAGASRVDGLVFAAA